MRGCEENSAKGGRGVVRHWRQKVRWFWFWIRHTDGYCYKHRRRNDWSREEKKHWTGLEPHWGVFTCSRCFAERVARWESRHAEKVEFQKREAIEYRNAEGGR
jgi:hypothetical protein